MTRQLMTVEQILSILRDTPERLRGLAGDLAEAKLHAAPEPGEWSVTEIAAHLRSCRRVGSGHRDDRRYRPPDHTSRQPDHLDQKHGLPRASVRFVVAGVQKATRSAARSARTAARPRLVANRHRARGWQTTGAHRAFVCEPPGPPRADSLEAGGEDSNGGGAALCVQPALTKQIKQPSR